jgi:4-amino-4-deoxychorismate lyase
MYYLLSSTRFDTYLLSFPWNNDHDGPSSFFLLPYHFDRLVDAAKKHEWDQINLSYQLLKLSCTQAVNSHASHEDPTALRVGVLATQETWP